MGLTSKIVSFVAGTYFGFYLSKNYDLPYIPPGEILDIVQKKLDEYKKDKPDK